MFKISVSSKIIPKQLKNCPYMKLEYHQELIHVWKKPHLSWWIAVREQPGEGAKECITQNIFNLKDLNHDYSLSFTLFLSVIQPF